MNSNLQQKVVETINLNHPLTKQDNNKPFYKQDYKITNENMEEIEVKLSETNYGIEINRLLAIYINQETIKLNQYNQNKVNLGEIKLNPPVSDFNAFLLKYSGNYDYGVDQGVMQSLYTWTFVYEGDGKTKYYNEGWLKENYIDQNKPLPQINKMYSEEFFRLQGKLIAMGYSREDSEIVLNAMNSNGLCTNAALCNAIFYEFSNSPEEFEKVFGYPMFITDKDGNKLLNSAELLLDLYVVLNDQENNVVKGSFLLNGNSINRDCLNYTINILGDVVYKISENTLATTPGYLYNDALKFFFDEKNLQYSRDGKTSCSKEEIQQIMEEGKSIMLKIPNIIDSGGATSFVLDNMGYSYPSVDLYGECGEGHAVSITGVTDDGVIVSSWGRKYKIAYETMNISGIVFEITDIGVNNK